MTEIVRDTIKDHTRFTVGSHMPGAGRTGALRSGDNLGNGYHDEN
jgi:hypothetical protein